MHGPTYKRGCSYRLGAVGGKDQRPMCQVWDRQLPEGCYPMDHFYLLDRPSEHALDLNDRFGLALGLCLVQDVAHGWSQIEAS